MLVQKIEKRKCPSNTNLILSTIKKLNFF